MAGHNMAIVPYPSTTGHANTNPPSRALELSTRPLINIHDLAVHSDLLDIMRTPHYGGTQWASNGEAEN